MSLAASAARTRRPRRRPRPLLLAGAGLLALSLLGCGGETPELLGLEQRLELRPRQGGNPYESLSVFVAVRDQDGYEDLEALWIVHDAEELYWSFSPKDWTSRDEGGERWIGSADLAMPDRRPLPRGAWRVLVADLAGRRAERPFRLDGGGENRAPPLLERSGTGFVLKSVWPETMVLAYDAVGALLRAAPAKPGTIVLETLLGAQEAQRTTSAAAYGYDPAARRGAYSWTVKTR